MSRIDGFAGVARQESFISSQGLVFRFNRLRVLHPLSSCVSSSKKLINFMHFHNSCIRNRDHHILLIITGNACKEFCHKLLLIFVREEGLKHNQN